MTEIELPRKISERPCRIDVDARGRIYIAARPMVVASTGNIDIKAHPHATAFRYAILRYAPSSYPPRAGTEYGLPIIFALPGEVYGAAVDPSDGHVYAASVAVLEYSPDGKLLNTARKVTDGNSGAFFLDARDVGVWERNHEVFVGMKGDPEGVEGEEWAVDVYDGKTHRVIDTIQDVSGEPDVPYPSIAVDQANGDVYVEDFKSHRVEQFRKDRRSGKYELIASIRHGAYLKRPEEGADLAVDGSTESPNYGYLFVTSETSSGAHLYAFAPAAARSRGRKR